MNKKIKESKIYLIFNTVWWFLVIVFEVLFPITITVLSFMDIIRIGLEYRYTFAFIIFPILLLLLLFFASDKIAFLLIFYKKINYC